jgi:Ca-activated chloride channel family protein
MLSRLLNPPLALLAFSSLALAFQAAGPIDARVAPLHPSRSLADLDAPEAHLHIDASLVLIPVQVSTEIGAPITQLTKQNFRIFEDGVEQTITHFAMDDAPISIGIVFDSSGSMQKKMHKSIEAAATFFKTANPQDEFFLIDFNERPHLVVGFTPDSADVYRRISRTKPFGRTALFDAIEMAVHEMKHAKNQRKAIVIVSDGGDNRSRMTFGAVKSLMREADVQMYSMGIFDPEETPKLPREEQEGPKLLDELTELTGGRNYRIDNLDELPNISARIGMQLRNQYVIGYTPSHGDRDGRYRRVKLSLVGQPELPKLRVQYRTGYTPPEQ